MNTKNKKNINEQLEKGQILPLLLRLAIPVTVAQTVNALYSLVDRMYIGHMPEIGTSALSGLALTFPVIMIISAFSALIGNGGAPLASIRLGAGDKKGAEELLGNSFAALLIMGGILTILFSVFCDPILMAFGASPTNLPYASDYLKIYVLGTIFVQLSLGLNYFLNAQGYTQIGMATVIIGAVLNTILDPVFIYLFDMGIAGAAVATVISQFASAVWVVLFLFSKKVTLRISLKNMRIKWANLKKICSLGVSMFTFQMNESLVSIVLNWLLRIYGGASSDIFIAAMGTNASISQIFFMPLKGIVQGAQPIIGYNMGARNYSRIQETLKYERRCSMTCAVVMWGIIMLFPQVVAGIFTPDPDLIAMCCTTLRMTFCTVFMLGMQMVNQNAFIAMGNAKLSFLFGILRKVILLIPLACILPLFLGAWGVFWAEAAGNFFATIITYIVFKRYMEKIKIQFSSASAMSS